MIDFRCFATDNSYSGSKALISFLILVTVLALALVLLSLIHACAIPDSTLIFSTLSVALVNLDACLKSLVSESCLIAGIAITCISMGTIFTLTMVATFREFTPIDIVALMLICEVAICLTSFFEFSR